MSGDTYSDSVPSGRQPARSGGARETGLALECHYRFALWLVPELERFPRRQEFLLSDRIQGAALDARMPDRGDLDPAAWVDAADAWITACGGHYRGL